MSAAACRRMSIGNLIESMDYCDSTRSHELTPYSRLRSRHDTRRNLHMIARWLGGSAAVAAVLAGLGSL